MSTITVSTIPDTADLTVYHGDTRSQTFKALTNGEPMDLTGTVLTSSCRTNAGTVHPMTVTTLDPTQGTFALHIPTIDPADYRYDIQANQNGAISSWVRGRLRVTRDVTP